MYFENKFYGKILWWESFFEGYCCQREYRGPTIKKNYNFGETIFFTDFCFPQTKWIRLVSFINVVHKIDAINKNRSLEKLFSKENMFLLNRFEWRSYKCGGRGGCGVLKTDDRREKLSFRELFHRKSFHINVFVWFGIVYHWGYTQMMIETKSIFKI